MPNTSAPYLIHCTLNKKPGGMSAGSDAASVGSTGSGAGSGAGAGSGSGSGAGAGSSGV